MKYLTLFETSAAYNAATLDLPNVSLIEENMDVHYNPYVPETKLIVYYDIQDISSPTTIFTNYDNSVKSIEVDGTLLNSVVTTYQFDSVGEHVIKYEFNNPTKVGGTAPLFHQISNIKRVVTPNVFTSIDNNAFNSCYGLTSVTIPDSVTNIGNAAFFNCSGLISIDIPSGVTSIGENAFGGCSGLTTCTIGGSVTSIGDNAFQFCNNLTSIICNATTAPTITSITFKDIKTGGTLTVPSSSSGYDVWMGTGNYYLGNYGWTKVEQ